MPWLEHDPDKKPLPESPEGMAFALAFALYRTGTRARAHRLLTLIIAGDLLKKLFSDDLCGFVEEVDILLE